MKRRLGIFLGLIGVVASSSSNFTLGAYLNYLLRTDKNSKWKAGFYAVFSNIAW